MLHYAANFDEDIDCAANVNHVENEIWCGPLEQIWINLVIRIDEDELKLFNFTDFNQYKMNFVTVNWSVGLKIKLNDAILFLK